MAKQNIVSVAVTKQMIDWLDTRRKTEFGILNRSEVIRQLIRNEMLKEQEEP